VITRWRRHQARPHQVWPHQARAANARDQALAVGQLPNFDEVNAEPVLASTRHDPFT
jgi:hypothetical protein